MVRQAGCLPVLLWSLVLGHWSFAMNYYFVYRRITRPAPLDVEPMGVGSEDLAGAVTACDYVVAYWRAAGRYPCHPWERLVLVQAKRPKHKRAVRRIERHDRREYAEFVELMGGSIDAEVER